MFVLANGDIIEAVDVILGATCQHHKWSITVRNSAYDPCEGFIIRVGMRV